MAIYKSDNIFQRLDLSLLRHFFAIATFGGFSKASRATGISQPALSLGLQKLEKNLGTRLVDRKPGKFSLTDSGKVLQAYCRRLEGTIESLMSDLGGKGPSVPRRLRIGTALSVGFSPLVRACVSGAAASSGLELELTAHNTYQLLTEVKEGTLDCALVPDDVYDKSLRATPLFRDALVFVQKRGPKVLLARDWLSGKLDCVLVTYPRETPVRSAIDKLCSQHELHFSSVISVSGLDAIVTLVRRGVGGAFVLRSLVKEELKRKELQEAKVPFELPSAGVTLVTAKDEPTGEVARLLKRLL